jgi:hypothetical protein
MGEMDDEPKDLAPVYVPACFLSPDSHLAVHAIRRGIQTCGSLARKDRDEVYHKGNEQAKDCQRDKEACEFFHCIR